MMTEKRRRLAEGLSSRLLLQMTTQQPPLKHFKTMTEKDKDDVDADDEEGYEQTESG